MAAEHTAHHELRHRHPTRACGDHGGVLALRDLRSGEDTDDEWWLPGGGCERPEAGAPEVALHGLRGRRLMEPDSTSQTLNASSILTITDILAQ